MEKCISIVHVFSKVWRMPYNSCTKISLGAPLESKVALYTPGKISNIETVVSSRDIYKFIPKLERDSTRLLFLPEAHNLQYKVDTIGGGTPRSAADATRDASC